MKRIAIVLGLAAVAVAQWQPAPVVPMTVQMLGEVRNGSVPCAGTIRLSEAIRLAGATQDADLAFTVVMRQRDQYRVDRFELTVRRVDIALVPGDVVWIARRPAPGEPALTRAAVLVAAVRAALAAPDIERRGPLCAWLLSNSADRVDRQQAAQQLALVPDRAYAVRALVSALDLDPSIAREAVVALGMMGRDAAAAVPELKRLLDHRDAGLRVLAAAAVRQINAAAKK